MRIVWDERKRAQNLREHSLDFADVDREFDFNTAIVSPTYASKDGRARFKAIGRFRNKLVVLVFSRLGSEAISLISFRPASREERKAYEEG